MLVLRDLQKQYSRYRLGYVWTLLEPLGMVLVMAFVFSVLLGGKKLGLQPYLLFLAVAILPWWWFTKGVSASTRSFRKRGSQLRVSLLPTELWVLRALLVSMAEFLLSLPIVLVAMIVTRTMPGPLIIFFPVAIVVQFFLMYGLSLLVSAGSVITPDLAHIVRIALRALFYLSPVLYSLSNIPARLQEVAIFNPLVGLFSLYRLGFASTEHESLKAYAVLGVIVLAVLLSGFIVFRRTESRILKDA